MPESRHQSPRDRARAASWVLLSAVVTLFAVGCDKIQIPDLTQQAAPPAPAPGAAASPTGQATPGQGAGPVVPQQTAKPDPKLVVAAFLDKAKQVGQVEDQDLLQVTELTEGLDEVKELRLVGAKITDAGVARLSKFPQLENVDLSGSLVSNEGLGVIKEMPALRSIALSDTKIDDTGMTVIAQKTDLKELAIGKTGVTDYGLDLLKDVKELELLDISNTRITGKGFEKFKGNKKLRVLRAQHSGIQNGAMKFLAECPIEELNIDVTGIGDAGFMFIGRMSKMRKLSMEFCGVSDVSVKRMKNWNQLETISVRNNIGISGALFDNIKGSKGLEYVNVSGTRVSPTDCAKLMKILPGVKIARD